MLRMMRAHVTVRGNTVSMREPARLTGVALDVPGDLSSAAFLVAAALIAPAGSELSLEHVGVNPSRTGLLDALASFGAKLKLERPGRPSSEPVARMTVSAQKL